MQGSISGSYQNPAWVLLVMECRVVIPFQMNSRQPCWALLRQGLQWLSYPWDKFKFFPWYKILLLHDFCLLFLGISAFLSLSMFTSPGMNRYLLASFVAPCLFTCCFYYLIILSLPSFWDLLLIFKIQFKDLFLCVLNYSWMPFLLGKYCILYILLL